MIAVCLDCTGVFDHVEFDVASEALTTNGIPKGDEFMVHIPIKRKESQANL